MKVSGFTNLMQVNNSNRKANNSQVNNRASYPNLAPLKKDTVSFCAKLNETDKSDELTPEEIKRIVTQSGDRRVDDADIEALSLIVDKDKMPLLEKIASMKRFSGKNIVRLMSSVNKKNEPLFDELANLRSSNGSNRLNGRDIAILMPIINKDNKPLFEKLIGMKDDKGRCLIRGNEVVRIFSEVYKYPEVYKYNIQRCEKLLRNGHPVCDELIYNLRHGCGSCWPF